MASCLEEQTTPTAATATAVDCLPLPPVDLQNSVQSMFKNNQSGTHWNPINSEEQFVGEMRMGLVVFPT